MAWEVWQNSKFSKFWCVYYCHGGVKELLCLYLDDILIFGTNIDLINEIKSFLSKFFYMKDMRGIDVNLNINLIKGLFGLVMSYRKVDVSCDKS